MENTTVLKLHAYYAGHYARTNPGAPQSYEFTAVLPSRNDAVAFAAQFPKSAKMFGGTLSCYDNGRSYVQGYASSHGNLVSNGVNGGVNESALRRYKAIVAAAAKLGVEIQYEVNALNSYPTRESFEKAVA